MPSVLKCYGPPGTGKTTANIETLQRELDAGIPPDRIGYVSFTRRAAAEAVSRLPIDPREMPWCRTLHSMAYRWLGLTRSDVMTEEHYREFGREHGYRFTVRRDDVTGLWEPRSDNLLLNTVELSRQTLISLADAARITGVEVPLWALERLAAELREFKSREHLLDYTDMLEQMDDGPALDVLIIDEAQDLTPLQWRVARRLMRGCQRVYIAGDDDQCQPPGTMVHTQRGQVPIEHLRDDDGLLVYAVGDAQIYGKRRRFGFRRAVRHYDGLMYRISVAGRETRATAEHIWLCKWPREWKSSNTYCVYLMRKGAHWRVGMTQMFNADGCSLFVSRLRHERADALWILDVVRGKQQARILETVYAARYGLPQITFVPMADARVMTQSAINAIYGQLNTGTGARLLLKHKGLLERHPLVRADKLNRFGAQVFECVSANLLPGMLLPVPRDDMRGVTWHPALVDAGYYSGPVYSLDVDVHHTYIADGIVTHNCIYSWAGADVGELLRQPGSEMVLAQSYRIPCAVQRYAQRVVDGIRERRAKAWEPRDEEGFVEMAVELSELVHDAGSWMFLARTHRQTGLFRRHLMDQGRLFRTASGGSVRDEHWAAIRTWEALRKGRKRPAKLVRQALRLIPDATPLARDIPDDAEVGYEAREPWYEVMRRIGREQTDYIRRCLANGEREPRCYVGTIHSVKGGEADYVVLHPDAPARVTMATDAERRVWYVALTRARRGVYVLRPQTRNNITALM